MIRKALLAGCLAIGMVSPAVAQYQSGPAPATNAPYRGQNQQPYAAQNQQPAGGQYAAPRTQQVPPQQQPQIRRVAGEAPVTGNPNYANPNGGQPGNVITNPPGSVNPNVVNQPAQPFNQRPGTTQAPNGGQNPQGAAIPPPAPFPQLTPPEQQFVDAILQQWEVTSGKVQRFKCSFKRWEYDPNFGPKATEPGQSAPPRTFAEGTIQFEAPDKGMFKVEEMSVYTPPKTPEDKPYVKQAKELNEDWRCDGKSVFKFDGRNKQLVETILPKEMQGKAIAEGPLPFLFGAKANMMKNRYFVRPISRVDRPKEYWLEAYPKYRGDAANYQKVLIALDKQTFMPSVIQLYAPNFDERTNPEYSTYEFSSQEQNWNPVLENINLWHEKFFEPKLPPGWTKVVEDANAPPPGPAPGGQGQAQAPSGPVR